MPLPTASFSQALIDMGGSQEIFTRTIDNELIDWTNKVDIAIPLWANKVEFEFISKSGQAGAANPLKARFNSDVGANYGLHALQAAGTTVSASQASGLTEFGIGLLSPVVNGIRYVADFAPKNTGTYIAMGFRRHFNDGSKNTGLVTFEYQNTVDDVTSVQIFTSNSTTVSGILTVRAWG